jgi:DNA-directed RNA polymerase subunit M/transcription elongation factor TFIIS
MWYHYGMKYCSRCQRFLLEKQFARHDRDGLQNWCRSCMNKESTRSRQQPERRRVRSTQEHKRISMKVYGLSSEEYDLLMGKRVCEVCGGTTKITLDHNHKTGKAAGVLCMKCNLALGHMQDNPVTIRKLAEYAERTRYGLASR